ncbi:cytotoxic and regulatory T-cell molecule isoform X1 [Sphaerodactylus townsendi]|uniref:cytotoxic and regulatory T-cell molecule isoform X1 n=1 Tax=Sphaerodactylus townsendi TaxID=933632 RepID=UPI002026FBC1|nr:cytotoxic and regulatory T-cell molecule isoform X1 [Sphaerodactylus townsendi]XP_048368485.1 cytotoxic and regulatory T-cell molecule isoform X1 [Sphaerodactylus townsendi]
MDLHCVVLGDNTSVLQWSKPPFTIFLGRHQGLKDKRYQLINSSVDRLSVRISNVTTDDEGLYTCYHYGAEGTAKQVNVTILAAPSKPLLEESTIRAHNKEEIIILRCSTQKSKPRPQITWLLDNGIELFGDTHHQCEQNGKKCNTTSSLKVRTFNQKSTITCVVRHKALGGGNLTATIHLSHIKSTTDTVPTTSEFGMTTLEHPWRYTANILNMTEENFRTQRSPLSSKADTPNSTTTNGMSESENILNVTEGNFGAPTTSARNETATQDLNSTGGTNVTYEGFLKKPSKLLPILVATLLSILSVAVLLLLVKVWKAHREWKRENDSSDPTLENYKARPNEDNHAQNRHVASWRSSKKHASEESWHTSSKKSEESNGSVFEKQLPYIKGLDL